MIPDNAIEGTTLRAWACGHVPRAGPLGRQPKTCTSRAAGLGVVIALAMASAPAGAQQIVGTFKARLATEMQSAVMTLRCETETACTLVAETREAKEPPSRSTKQLEARRLENYREVSYAFRHVLERKDVDVGDHAEYAAIMKQLRPMLEGKAALDKCWELIDRSESLLVACSVAHEPWSRSSLLLMGTLLSDNCPPPFCRYVNYPMQREP